MPFLAEESRAAGAVRTVDLGVAVQAAAIAHGVELGAAGQTGMGDTFAAHIVGRRMAVKAQERHLFLQQPRIRGAMRIMAVGAVFANRLVLPQIRAALVGVAAIAEVGDAHIPQHIGTGRTMGVVAIRADHLALANRVMRVLQGQRTLFGMAGEAHLRLRRLNQHRILGDMDGVAADAGQIVDLMLASDPGGMVAVLVAAQADLVAHGDRRCIGALEHDAGRSGLAGGEPGGMGVAGSVAGFAFMLAERRTRVAFGSVRRLQDVRHRRLAVALQAGGGAALGIHRARRRRIGGGRRFCDCRSRIRRHGRICRAQTQDTQ